MPVAAFTRKRQFNKAFRQLGQEIETRKAAGLSEEVEFVTGVQHHKGYLAETREIRMQDRARRQALKTEGPPPDD